MSNVFNEEKRRQVIALGRLGWPLRALRAKPEFDVRLPVRIGKPPVSGSGHREPGTTPTPDKCILDAIDSRLPGEVHSAGTIKYDRDLSRPQSRAARPFETVGKS